MNRAAPRTIIRIAVLAIVALAIIAWGPSITESPHTGTYSQQALSTGLRTNARSMQWNVAGVNAIQTNGWVEYFDQTADCVGSPKVGDKLYAQYAVTDIPNNGAFSSNDCDGPNPNVNEEIELDMGGGAALWAGLNYQYDVVWHCNNVPISGEVNITFELGTVWSKDNLDKEVYSISSCIV